MDAKRIAEIEAEGALEPLVGELLAALRASEAKLAVAVECLEWYADHEKRSHYDPLHPENMGSPWVRARAAMAKIAEGET